MTSEGHVAGLRTTQGAPVPLEGVDVTGEILGGHARVVVKQRWRNSESKPIEAVYVFPLPSDGTLSGFAMTCDGRRLQGVVKEREQAFRDYDDALLAGHGAALLEQERPNVFTASVGNLLPGEETTTEVEYLQRLTVDEGAVRFMLPTVVAPRYIPGTPAGDRTSGGVADPTDAVPDADRITPPTGKVSYGFTLDLTIALDGELAIESPSHALTTTNENGRWRVKLAQQKAALDRDLVVLVRGTTQAPLAGVMAHRDGEQGVFALTVVPDLFDPSRRIGRQKVVFLIDVSGSMDGESLPQAKAAAKLCLRQLREGDQFELIAFESTSHPFQGKLSTYSDATLKKADRWIDALTPMGGTELMQPLVSAVQLAGVGLVVLLTDGQVGNEAQILARVLEETKGARIFTFGIGTAVSDVLLRDLARHTGGGMELIHPGERIDEKVIATFAKATAPTVRNLSVKLRNVEAGELAPEQHARLVDGEAWTLFGRYVAPGEGVAELRGELDGQPWSLDVPLSLPDQASAPALGRLWASERIRDLEAMQVTGRRADAMKDRIVKLAVEHGVSSPYTSFLVVEERTGDRRSNGQPQTRFVPVSAPAGWRMLEKQEAATMGGMMPGAVFASVMPPRAAPPPSPAPMKRARSAAGLVDRAKSVLPRMRKETFEAEVSASVMEEGLDPVQAILTRQLASGLWSHATRAGDEGLVLGTAEALASLHDLGVTTGHAVYGAQVKKAVEAIVQLATRVSPALAELALAAAWLSATGSRLRQGLEVTIRQRAWPELEAAIVSEALVKQRVQAGLAAA